MGWEMTKGKWVEHIEASGVVRPSMGGSIEVWKAEVKRHQESNCRECAERRNTRNKNRWAREKHQVMVDCGLKRVRGALGGIYYE
jgi:hypothetical protein